MADHIVKISHQDSIPITFNYDEANKLFNTTMLWRHAGEGYRMVEFLVVNKPLVYNVILGISLNALKVVVLTYHLAMKFPIPNGVEIFKGN
ncbi:hypothetical protein TIFTF001_029233 [Ficus carica]|uniref:Uncharacterized protein n=1 Tax=Ficus carica TaxID=3494 RepID=A0AA88J2K2_FICCA|nr:hypothetical protein TIFTF001_029233 [Ficus carica]